jgi:hypothetical protein
MRTLEQLMAEQAQYSEQLMEEYLTSQVSDGKFALSVSFINANTGKSHCWREALSSEDNKRRKQLISQSGTGNYLRRLTSLMPIPVRCRAKAAYPQDNK